MCGTNVRRTTVIYLYASLFDNNKAHYKQFTKKNLHKSGDILRTAHNATLFIDELSANTYIGIISTQALHPNKFSLTTIVLMRDSILKARHNQRVLPQHTDYRCYSRPVLLVAYLEQSVECRKVGARTRHVLLVEQFEPGGTWGIHPEQRLGPLSEQQLPLDSITISNIKEGQGFFASHRIFGEPAAN